MNITKPINSALTHVIGRKLSKCAAIARLNREVNKDMLIADNLNNIGNKIRRFHLYNHQLNYFMRIPEECYQLFNGRIDKRRLRRASRIANRELQRGIQAGTMHVVSPNVI